MLGVRPILGRNLLPQEEEGADVAMVTERFWKSRFGGDPDVIGKRIALDGVAHTIVGVIAERCRFRGRGPKAEVWTTKPFGHRRDFSYERIMRGSGVPARGRALEAGT